MRRRATAVAAMLAAFAIALMQPVRAQMVDGQVVKIDESAGKITIRHGPLKKFDMDEGMTMVWRVQDAEMLKGLRAGDRIKFEPDRVNGQFTATRIQKAK